MKKPFEKLTKNVKGFKPNRKICPKCQPMHWFPNQYRFCPYCATKLKQNEEIIHIHRLGLGTPIDAVRGKEFEDKHPDTDRLI